MIGVERGFALEDADGTLTAPARAVERPGRADERGRLRPRRPLLLRVDGLRPAPGRARALYRLDPDGRPQVVLEGVTVSNGLEWSPDGSLAYYNDTATHRVDVFDYDAATRACTDRRPFADAPRRRAARRADGRRRGRRLDGPVRPGRGVAATPRRRALTRSVEVPAPQGDRLHVRRRRTSTSCSSPPRGRTSTPGEDPLAGSLFRADVGVRGLPVREFAG